MGITVNFDRSKHVFFSDVFAEIIKDTIRFFNGTPVHHLPPPENFIGTGVYARFMILEDAASDMIGTVEAALIREYKPIWNNSIDGFGNHDPGAGRYDQALSDWDILHPGRKWTTNLKGEHITLQEVEGKIEQYFKVI